MFDITFIFDRCLCSIAAETPVKYECDSIDLNYTFYTRKMSIMGKLTPIISTPHPCAHPLYIFAQQLDTIVESQIHIPVSLSKHEEIGSGTLYIPCCIQWECGSPVNDIHGKNMHIEAGGEFLYFVCAKSLWRNMMTYFFLSFVSYLCHSSVKVV